MDTQRGRFSFRVAEFADGTPWIMTDPLYSEDRLAALGRGGTFVVVGTMPNLRSDKSAVVSAAPMYLVNKEITIMGTRYATRAEIARSLDLVRDGKVKPVIGASFPLAQAEDALEAIRRNQVFGRILIDCAD